MIQVHKAVFFLEKQKDEKTGDNERMNEKRSIKYKI